MQASGGGYYAERKGYCGDSVKIETATSREDNYCFYGLFLCTGVRREIYETNKGCQS